MSTPVRIVAAALFAVAVSGSGTATGQAHEPDREAVKAFTSLVDAYRGRAALTVHTTITVELSQAGTTSESRDVEADFLLGAHYRDLTGTSAIFRANVLTTGDNDFNNNYDRETVYFDEGDNNPQEYDNSGVSLKFTYNFGGVTLTSITAYDVSKFMAYSFSIAIIIGTIVTALFSFR